MEKAGLAHLAVPGREIAVRVSAGASRTTLRTDGSQLRISVTAVPEAGKANRAVTKLLARALGVAPTRLTLLRGDGARDKVFRLD